MSTISLRFAESETRLPALLERLGLLDGFGKTPLAEIESTHESEWRRVRAAVGNPSGAPLALAFSRFRSDYTEALGHYERAIEVRDQQRKELERLQSGRIAPLMRHMGALLLARARRSMRSLLGGRRGND